MRYRIFGRHTGLRVSALALGTGMFGTGWGYGSEPEVARKVFEGYAEAGGNFIDTADSYQFGQSESLVGEFVAAERDHFVVATKYTQGANPKPGLVSVGNSRKALVQSVDASLKRLRTDRIDFLWVHMADGVTPIEEIMRGLDDLARSGRILYAGFSNFPAWRIASAATLADLRGWLPVAGLQSEYSLVQRTPERELLPMADAHGLGVVAWSPLGGGLLTGKYRRGERGRATELGRVIQHEDTAQRTAIVDAVLQVAEETGASAGQVAIAWVAAHGLLPIIGPKNRAQLDDNLAALALRLSADHLARLDAVSAVPLGAPHEMLADPGTLQRLAGGKFDLVDPPGHAVA